MVSHCHAQVCGQVLSNTTNPCSLDKILGMRNSGSAASIMAMFVSDAYIIYQPTILNSGFFSPCRALKGKKHEGLWNRITHYSKHEKRLDSGIHTHACTLPPTHTHNHKYQWVLCFFVLFNNHKPYCNVYHLQTGRKPSGLCGAALYISALSHGYRFSKSDIVGPVYLKECLLFCFCNCG